MERNCRGGVTHLSPGEVAIGEMRDEMASEGGKTGEKHTWPLTFWKEERKCALLESCR